VSRTALIHVGAHKTGSTSLQTLFTRHRAELRQRGILYPVTGVRPNPDEIDSHTNVAWELRGHTHFNPASGTLDQVIEEIETSECPKVLLSSEEFACLFDQPDELGRLKKSLEGAGLAPHVCLVLRDPTEVAESLYITLAGYGLDLSFAEYFQIVTEEGRFSTPDNTYCFDNTVLARSFVDVFGEDAVTCVEYDPRDAVRPVLDAHDWFFLGALADSELDIRYNTTVSRVEELRSTIRSGELRIAALELELERARADSRSLQARLTRSEEHLRRRVERRIRATLQLRRPL
jgi:hypothetical protein